MSKTNRMKQVCCAMDGIKKMFNERWSGSMNYLYMEKKILNTKFFLKKINKKKSPLYKQ